MLSLEIHNQLKLGNGYQFSQTNGHPVETGDTLTSICTAVEVIIDEEDEVILTVFPKIQNSDDANF